MSHKEKERKKNKSLRVAHFRGKYVIVARERQLTFFIGEHRAYHWRHVHGYSLTEGVSRLKKIRTTDFHGSG